MNYKIKEIHHNVIAVQYDGNIRCCDIFPINEMKDFHLIQGELYIGKQDKPKIHVHIENYIVRLENAEYRVYNKYEFEDLYKNYLIMADKKQTRQDVNVNKLNKLQEVITNTINDLGIDSDLATPDFILSEVLTYQLKMMYNISNNVLYNSRKTNKLIK